jgi:hypothetical protein
VKSNATLQYRMGLAHVGLRVCVAFSLFWVGLVSASTLCDISPKSMAFRREWQFGTG